MRARWAILFGAAAVAWLSLAGVAAAAPKKPSPSPVATASGAAGPVWTYQMSKITVLLLVVMILALGALYYRLVVKRRRGEI